MMQSLDRVWNFSKRLFTRTSKDARSVILTLVKCGLRDPKLVTGGKVRRSNGKPGRSRKPTSRCAIRWSGWKGPAPAMQTAGVAIEERLALFKEFNPLYRNQNGNMLANLFGQSLSRKDERNMRGEGTVGIHLNRVCFTLGAK